MVESVVSLVSILAPDATEAVSEIGVLAECVVWAYPVSGEVSYSVRSI